MIRGKQEQSNQLTCWFDQLTCSLSPSSVVVSVVVWSVHSCLCLLCLFSSLTSLCFVLCFPPRPGWRCGFWTKPCSHQWPDSPATPACEGSESGQGHGSSSQLGELQQGWLLHHWPRHCKFHGHTDICGNLLHQITCTHLWRWPLLCTWQLFKWHTVQDFKDFLFSDRFRIEEWFSSSYHRTEIEQFSMYFPVTLNRFPLIIFVFDCVRENVTWGLEKWFSKQRKVPEFKLAIWWV